MHAVFILQQSLVQVLLVVDVALLHAQHFRQSFRAEHGVAHPGHITQIVFLALVDLHQHVHVLVVDVPYGVFDDGSVAVAQLVVFLNELLACFLVAFVGKLLCLEQVGQFARLVYLSEGALAEERTFNLLVRQVLVSLDGDAAHLHLVFLVDVYVEDDLVLARHVVALYDVDLGILVSLFVEIAFGQQFRTVNHVGRNLAAHHDAEFSLHIFAFRLLDAAIVNHAYAGTQGQVDAEIDFVAHERVGNDRHFGEQSVVPVALHGLCDFRARHVDSLSHLKS